MKSESVILSIHPEVYQKIVDGKKKWELRRQALPGHVKTVYFYLTAPVKEIAGCFDCTLVVRPERYMAESAVASLWDAICEIETRNKWNHFQKDRREFEKYLGNALNPVAYRIQNFLDFSGMLLSYIDPKVFDPDFTGPQHFRYATGKLFERLEGERKRAKFFSDFDKHQSQFEEIFERDGVPWIRLK